jgi:FkbM family methyltransferase
MTAASVARQEQNRVAARTRRKGTLKVPAQQTFQDIIGHPVPRIRILDIGAMPEGQDRYHELLTAGLAEVIGFEPNPEQFARLQGRIGPYRYLPVFLGDGGRASFNVTRYPGCCSLLEPDAALIDLFETLGCADPQGNFHVQKSAAVKTTRLDDLGPDVVADFIKIDVQGAELDILRHGIAKLKDTVVLESEVEFAPLYKNQPLFGDIQCFLREQGLVFHKFIDVGGRSFRPIHLPNPYLPMSQLLWADAIFVRDFTRLESYSEQGLLKAAAVLDMVYGSYDLVALLLGEYDRRRQSDLCGRYLQLLPGRQLRLRCLNMKDHP